MPDNVTAKKPNILTKKIGPLPAVGWVAAAAGTYLVYHLYQAHEANTAAASGSGTTASDTGIDPNTGVPYSTEEAAYQAAQGSTSTAVTTAAGLPGSWEASALAYLTDKKGGNLTDAQAVSALQDWLNGQPIPYNAANALSIFVSKHIPAGYNLESLPTIISEAKPPTVTTAHTPSEKVVTAIDSGTNVVKTSGAKTTAPSITPKKTSKGATPAKAKTTPVKTVSSVPFSLKGGVDGSSNVGDEARHDIASAFDVARHGVAWFVDQFAGAISFGLF